MNRIPTEGLKLRDLVRRIRQRICLNEQNPDRGIETWKNSSYFTQVLRLNEQNPDRGIET